MADTSALLLRAIAEELSAQIIPNLTSADAIERANFARIVLLQLAADIDVVPNVAATLVPRMRATMAAALRDLPGDLPGDQPGKLLEQVTSWRNELQAIAPETGVACQREIAALRALAASMARALADRLRNDAAATGAPMMAALQRLGGTDYNWMTEYDNARSAALVVSTVSVSPGTVVLTAAASQPTASGAANIAPTVATLTSYLRRAFPQSPQIAATEVISIPGGRSKKTYFVSINGTDLLPAVAVIRQDYALKYEGTKVRNEYQPLAKLSALGLPVPRPLHLETAESEIGPPFMLVDRLNGASPGTYFGLQKSCPGAFRDLARSLAVLHRLPPADLGFKTAADPDRCLDHIVDQYETKWRANATKPSPLVDFAYAWARQQAQRDRGAVAVVHGDVGPYNFLVDNDRLTAILDWEFAHVGDPAEDLGIVRIYAEDALEWNEFLAIYASAGGPDISEHRVRLSMVLQFLKGTTLVAVSGRNFEEGGTREFTKGASAFTGQRLIELRIAALLRRFEAL